MLKIDTLKNGMSLIGLYGSAPPPRVGAGVATPKVHTFVNYQKTVKNENVNQKLFEKLGKSSV